MVGARDAVFYREALSMQYAPAVVAKVWRTAAAIGHGDRFIQETKYFVGIDDHVPINRKLRIPSIDTHDDNLSVIDRETLRAVGRTVLEVVWQER
jgi:hypothetical protein